MDRQRVAVVLGTRPEIIKLAGVLDLLGDRALLIHTGQHYDDQMSEVFLRGLGLRAPDHRLSLGGLDRAAQLGRGTEQLAHLLRDAAPAAVIVQGDTNSALAGGLAANAQGIPLVHVEAGLRSYDRAMPEEHNRVLVDHLADLLAAPTSVAVGNLAREGLSGPSVICTGNTVVEAVARQLPGRADQDRILREAGLEPAGFVLTTIHRPENTDDPSVLAAILRELARLRLPVVLPLHPRTAAAVERFGLAELLDPLRVIAPVSGGEFLTLTASAALVVSDSGGVQEEVTVLRRPLVVVRRSTERPESLESFAVMSSPDGIAAQAARFLDDVDTVLARLASVPSPFGDGTASAQVVAAVRQRYAG